MLNNFFSITKLNDIKSKQKISHIFNNDEIIEADFISSYNGKNFYVFPNKASISSFNFAFLTDPIRSFENIYRMDISSEYCTNYLFLSFQSDDVKKANEARKQAFEMLEFLLEENNKSGKWDFLFLSLTQESIDLAIEYGINDKEALILYGWISYIGNEPERAIRNYHYALSHFPEDPEIFYQMGNCFELSRNIDRAKFYWKKSNNDRALAKLKKYTKQ